MDTNVLKELTVPKLENPLRLDKFLIQEFPHTTRSYWRSHLNKSVKINGKMAKKGATLLGGEKLQIIQLPSLHRPELSANPDISIEILFEDTDFLAINKKAGIPCLPLKADAMNTIVNGVIAQFPEQAKVDPGNWESGLLHRLDNETSGVLLFAKNSNIKTEFMRLQKNNKVFKSYLAWVDGTPPAEGILKWPIAHHPKNQKKMICITDPDTAMAKKARPTQSDYELLKHQGEYSLLRIIIAKGLRHQIRVHLAQLGYPILGDKLYHPKPSEKYPHQLLHADQINFRHPKTGKNLRIKAPNPKDFKP